MDKRSVESKLITLEKVYYVDRPRDARKPSGLIAIAPKIDGERIYWSDTIRVVSIPYDSMSIDLDRFDENNPPNTIQVKSASHGDTTFTLLTKKIFDERLKDRVALGNELNFADDKAVQDYYLHTNFESY